MERLSRFFLALILLSGSIRASGQVVQPNKASAIKGYVRDSVYNHVIKSATVAVYKDEDGTLLNYSLTNNFGEFKITNIPRGLPLRLVLTCSGYQSRKRQLTIPITDSISDIKEIALKRNPLDSVIRLNEVEVRDIAPVRLRGDTLEFNAAAFKLDPNAVVDDLMRRLPGVTIWGDGTITVNGRKVNQLLVEGKPFFGGKSQMALQNLPKSSVDKIQIYKNKNNSNSADSLVDVNIKLKKNKQTGSFGKVSAGGGTNSRYQLDGMLNTFNRTTQLGIVGSINNTNKIPRDINQLMEYNSFKGIGASIDYEPDFFREGITRTKAAGLLLQHDFNPGLRADLKNRLNLNYFVTDISSQINRDLVNTSFLNGSSNFNMHDINSRIADELQHNVDGTYTNTKEHLDYNVKPEFTYSKGRSVYADSSITLLDGAKLVSTNTNSLRDEYSKSDLKLNTGFKMRHSNIRFLDNSDFNYKVELSQEDKTREVQSRYRFVDSINAPKDFFRNYANLKDVYNHEFTLNIRRLNALFFTDSRNSLQIGISNQLSFNKVQDNQRVFDLLEGRQENAYLTNRSQSLVTNYLPSLNLSKDYTQYRTDRYQKIWRASGSFQAQLIKQDSKSEKDFQNFSRQYNGILLNTSILYDNHQYGRLHSKFNVTYKNKIDIPDVKEIAPLVDSISLYYLLKGNPNLRKQYSHILSVSYERSTEKRNNNNMLSLSVDAATVKDKLSDSILYNNSGQREVFRTNVAGYRYLKGSLQFYQSFKVSHDHQIQMSLSSNFSFIRNPIYINQLLTVSRNTSFFNNLSLNYDFKNQFLLNLQQEYSYYRSIQSQGANIFQNSNLKTVLSGSYVLSKRITVGSNVNYTRNSTNIAPDRKFTIWNCNVTARFLKGNNLEAKFSALDILRQNSGVFNYNSDNIFTVANVNVLRSYYMVSLAFYPRLFGAK